MIEEREYQRRAVARILRLQPAQRLLLVSPTGSGKTTMGAMAILGMPGKRVLWLAHRIELLRQARNELLAAGLPPDEVGILSGRHRENLKARVIVASVGMLRALDVHNVDVIVVDEAHRSASKTYRAVLDGHPKATVLGLTATPWRLDGTPMRDIFVEMLVAAPMTELIADGYIARPVTYGVPYEKARSMVAACGGSKGDYGLAKLGRAMMQRSLLGDVVSEARRLAPGQPTLVFAVDRKHGRALLDRFVEDGRKAVYLDAETHPRERDRITSGLRSGTIDVVVNVDVLSEGFDCPAVKCIVLARPTKSLTRFLQYVGRGSRPYKGESPLILDHAGNCYRHNLPDADRDWSLDGRYRAATGVHAKRCPGCGKMMDVGDAVCTCGYEQPAPKREMREIDTALERIMASKEVLSRKVVIVRALAARRGLDDAWVSATLGELA